MGYLSIAWTGVYYIVYPIFYIICLILHVLSIITAPLFHLGHYIVYACSVVPIYILAKFEVGLQSKHLSQALSEFRRPSTSFSASRSWSVC